MQHNGTFLSDWKEEQKPSSGIREPWLHVELLNIVNINSHIKRV